MCAHIHTVRQTYTHTHTLSAQRLCWLPKDTQNWSYNPIRHEHRQIAFISGHFSLRLQIQKLLLLLVSGHELALQMPIPFVHFSFGSQKIVWCGNSNGTLCCVLSAACGSSCHFFPVGWRTSEICMGRRHVCWNIPGTCMLDGKAAEELTSLHQKNRGCLKSRGPSHILVSWCRKTDQQGSQPKL